MPCECKGLCDTFKNTYKKPGVVGYKEGRKRCKRCSYSMKTELLRCKCCKGLFKTKRTSGKNRKLNKIMRENGTSM